MITGVFAVCICLRSHEHRSAPLISGIQSGALRALAVTGGKRFPGLADVPTVIEAGVPGYDVASWNALAAPAKTPRVAIDRVRAELIKALANPEVQKRFAELGVEGRSSTPEQLRDFFAYLRISQPISK